MSLNERSGSIFFSERMRTAKIGPDLSLNELSLAFDLTPWAFRRVLQLSTLTKSTTELTVRLKFKDYGLIRPPRKTGMFYCLLINKFDLTRVVISNMTYSE